MSYWDDIAEEYQGALRISTDDFHYGPLLPGDRQFRLLPPQLSGLNCLELGCGGGQNSIFLARQGARCTAVDGASAQLNYAAELAHKHGASLRFVHADLDQPLPFAGEKFNLIHSSYTLPFLKNPAALIRWCATALNPGGILLISTAHPLAHAEWYTMEDDAAGIVLRDYFHPPVDEREENGHAVTDRPLPVSTLCEMLADAGFAITRLLEPQPAPLHQMTPEEIRENVPYDGDCWRPCREDMALIPRFIIIKASRL